MLVVRGDQRLGRLTLMVSSSFRWPKRPTATGVGRLTSTPLNTTALCACCTLLTRRESQSQDTERRNEQARRAHVFKLAGSENIESAVPLAAA